MLIPFSRLYLSDANVRKTRSEEDDIQLSADIEVSNGVQKGPPIGVEEGPPFRI